MDYSLFTTWHYIAICIAALFVGAGLRRYLDHRKRKDEENLRKERGDLKKRQKRYRKLMKKAGRK